MGSLDNLVLFPENALYNVILQQPAKFSHSPDFILSLARVLLHVGDTRVSSELVWGAVAMAMKDKASELGCIPLNSHTSFDRFVLFLKPHAGRDFMNNFNAAAR